MKRKVCYLILPLVTLVLEILPLGAVCNFATGPDNIVRQTFFYFDLIPFGYANFAPFLTAILTCIILALLVTGLFVKSHRVTAAVKILLLAGVVLSLCPLLYGITYYSIVGVLITLCLLAELVLLKKETYESH